MAVSRLIPAGGANDFNLSLTGQFTSVTFNKEYSSGSYSIISNSGDSTFDIYAYNNDGSLAGYTKTGSFTASKGFNKMVILGGTNGDVLSFTYKTTFVTADDSDEVTAGPVATSVTPSSVPKIDDTFTLTGRNFASNCTVTFTSANTAYTATEAKSIVRSSATSLIVTRPDNLIQDYSPYTITVQNPGVTNPTGSNSHILSNSVTAGSDPAWVTGSILSYITGTSTSLTLLATDADAGSDVDYSIVSGTLPTGLSLDGETGVISGTPSTSQQTVTFRATDQGGNYVDKAIKFNAAPTFVTSTMESFAPTVAYSQQIVISDDLSTSGATFTLASGSLPSGFSLSSSGVVSGTTTSQSTSSFTVTAVDAEGGSRTSGTITLPVSLPGGTFYSSVGTYSWTAPAGVTSVNVVAIGGGGSGAQANTGNAGAGGGLGWKNSISVTPGQSYTVVVGGGGTSVTGGGPSYGNSGGSSYFINTSTVAGYGGERGYPGDGANLPVAAGGGYVGQGGGNGGNGGYENVNTSGPGGGGAGGYSGNGGAGGSSVTSNDGNRSGFNGNGGGGGGGSAGGDTTGMQGGGGGGVGVYGQGSSGSGGQGYGAGSFAGSTGGGGGSGGSTGGNDPGGARYNPAGNGGSRGGGGAGTNDAGSGSVQSGAGAPGAVRIIWGGGRSFPSTNVGQNFGSISETVI